MDWKISISELKYAVKAISTIAICSLPFLIYNHLDKKIDSITSEFAIVKESLISEGYQIERSLYHVVHNNLYFSENSENLTSVSNSKHPIKSQQTDSPTLNTLMEQEVNNPISSPFKSNNSFKSHKDLSPQEREQLHQSFENLEYCLINQTMPYKDMQAFTVIFGGAVLFGIPASIYAWAKS